MKNRVTSGICDWLGGQQVCSPLDCSCQHNIQQLGKKKTSRLNLTFHSVMSFTTDTIIIQHLYNNGNYFFVVYKWRSAGAEGSLYSKIQERKNISFQEHIVNYGFLNLSYQKKKKYRAHFFSNFILSRYVRSLE